MIPELLLAAVVAAAPLGFGDAREVSGELAWAQYFLNLPRYSGRHMEINLAGEVTKGEIPLFQQWDRRWGYETYGGGLLAMKGCGPVCLSMVYCGLTGDTRWNPYEIACLAEERGYYLPGVGTSWDLMLAGARELGLEAQEIPLDGGYIINELRCGRPVICSMRPGDFTSGGHFIVLASADAEGKISVRDPNSKENSAKTWDVERLLPQIKGLWSYQLPQETREVMAEE